MPRLVVSLLVGLWALTGCATPYMQAQTALRQGRYDEATAHFEDVLARDPGRLDALVGLGVSRYKLGAFDEAVDALSHAVAQAPTHAAAQLYLGLGYLQKGEDGLAEEHLTTFRELTPEPRIAAQVDRALKMMRLDPLSNEQRGFIAASLDDEAEWAREARELRRAMQNYQSLYFYPRRFIILRPHRHRHRR